MGWSTTRFRAAASPSSTTEWLTPKCIIDALGPFDLDPCAPVSRPWPTASEHFTIQDDGLRRPWRGFVWMNPPYNRSLSRWMARFANHNNGIALVNARTETSWFVKYVWPKATALLFPCGRIRFCLPDGSQAYPAGSPSVFVAMGDEARARLSHSNLSGRVVLHSVRTPLQSRAEVHAGALPRDPVVEAPAPSLEVQAAEDGEWPAATLDALAVAEDPARPA